MGSNANCCNGVCGFEEEIDISERKAPIMGEIKYRDMRHVKDSPGLDRSIINMSDAFSEK